MEMKEFDCRSSFCAPAPGDDTSVLPGRRSLTGTTTLLAYLTLADFIAHMLFAGNYGYFRYELYYIVSGPNSGRGEGEIRAEVKEGEREPQRGGGLRSEVTDTASEARG